MKEYDKFSKGDQVAITQESRYFGSTDAKKTRVPVLPVIDPRKETVSSLKSEDTKSVVD